MAISRLLLLQCLVELMLSRRFLVGAMAPILNHGRTWRHAERLLESANLPKHLIRSLGVGVQLLSNRIDWFRERLDVWLEVALTFDGRCWDFRRLWYCGGRSPVLARAKHFLLNSLLFSFHLFSLFLSHEVLLHAWSALTYIKMGHLVALNPRIGLRFERGIFLLHSLSLSPLLLILHSYSKQYRSESLKQILTS